MPQQSKPTSSMARKPKQLNLKTYKYHSLGDYVDTIKRFGTTDSYSTQGVSSEFFICVNKGLMGYFRVSLSIEPRRHALLAPAAD
jgi:hypothetical protein